MIASNFAPDPDNSPSHPLDGIYEFVAQFFGSNVKILEIVEEKFSPGVSLRRGKIALFPRR